MASINIVLKAVDQYSSTITGLNQGFDLVGKSINVVAAIAETAWNAVKAGADFAFQGIIKAVELASKGGSYAEMRKQFDLVAQNYQVNGQSILDSLDEITANTIKLPDAVKIAGKGIAAGLTEQQLADAFTFIKRRTELTGESFASMSETMISALDKGKYASLKDMGLIIEKGATLEDVMQAITKATKSYGDAGYNTGDSIEALVNQQDSFLTKVGAAINASAGWQKIFDGAANYVAKLVKSFDYTPITKFVDVVVVAASGLIDTLGAFGVSDWLKKQRDDIARWVDDVGKLMVMPLKFLQDVVAELAAFQRNNPVLSKAVYGSYFNPEGFTAAEVSLDKLIRTMERGSTPISEMNNAITATAGVADSLAAAEARLKAATEAAMAARRDNTNTFFVDKELAAAQEAIEILKRTNSQGSSVDQIRADSGIDDLESDLDELIKKASEPVSKQTGLENAVNSATKPKSATDQLSSGLNLEAVKMALGDMILQYITGIASNERTPMAVLAA